jgi:hypothetical protein
MESYVVDVRNQIEAKGRPDKATEDGGISQNTYFGIINDISAQPYWREEANKAHDYYDNNSANQELLAELNRRGMPPLSENIVAPIVNSILGMEAKNRLDFRVAADDAEHQDRVEVLSKEMKQNEREAMIDDATSDAYFGQVIGGVGWNEVSRESDPFKYWLRVQNVHRNEMWWDMRAKDTLLADAQWKVRRRWFDVKRLKLFFPKKAEALDAAGSGRSSYMESVVENGSSRLMDLEIPRGWTWEEQEWRDTLNQRTCMYEVEYVQYVRGKIVRMEDGSTFEFDAKNPAQAEAARRGLIQVSEAVYSRQRGSLWVGPIKLSDFDLEDNESHYVPFFAYREDRTGVPYGPVRNLFSPQDEVNARKQKLMWLLSAKRLFLESGALDTSKNDVAGVLQELSRPDAVVHLTPGAIARQGIKVDQNFGEIKMQFEMMTESKRAAQEAVGIYSSVLGDAKQGARAGIAINSLIEQSIVGLAKMNDNHRKARTEVGRRAAKKTVRNFIGRPVQYIIGEGQRRRAIFLNRPVMNPETGAMVVENDMSKLQFKLTMQDVPQTPTYRHQQQMSLTEVLKSLPPEMMGYLLPAWVESSDLPDRMTLAKAIRRGLNIPETHEMAPEEEMQEAQAMQAQASEAAAFQKELAMAELAEKQAKAMKATAEAKTAMAELEGLGGADPAVVKEAQDKAQEAVVLATQREAELRSAFDEQHAKLESQLRDRDDMIRKLKLDAEAAARRNDDVAAQAAQQRGEAAPAKQEVVAKALTDELEKRITKANDDMRKDFEQLRKLVEGGTREEIEEVVEKRQTELTELIAKSEDWNAGLHEKTMAALHDMSAALEAREEPEAPKSIVMKKLGDGRYVAEVSSDGGATTIDVKVERP